MACVLGVFFARPLVAIMVSIPNVLSAGDGAEVTQRLSSAELVDGERTAGWHAK